MTASIRANCPGCGPVETPIDEAELRVSFAPTAPTSLVAFRCPSCRSAVETVVGERAVRLLMRAGVSVVGAPVGARHADAVRREGGR